MTTYRKELENVLLDSKAIGKLLTKVRIASGKLQEIIEEMDGINIMLVENVHDVLKKGETNDN